MNPAGVIWSEAYTFANRRKDGAMGFFCRIGLHQWAFSSQVVDEPGHERRSEIVQARCRRGCSRYGSWAVVHRERDLPGTPGHEAAPSLTPALRERRASGTSSV
jgi:hypothetical protein